MEINDPFKNKHGSKQRTLERRIKMAKKYLKWYLFSLEIRKLQIKLTLKVHLTEVRMPKIKKTNDNKTWQGFGKGRLSFPVDGIVNWCSHSGNQSRELLKKQEINLPYY